MRSALLALALTACGFPQPADQCDGTCSVFAIDQTIVNGGDEIWLEGNFEKGTRVAFPFADEVALNTRNDHRASVSVPTNAISADLSIVTSDGVRGKLPFRRVTFQQPKLQPFTAVNEQNDYARINYLDKVHTGGTAITIASLVYLIGGASGAAATNDVEVAHAGLDGSLGKPTLVGQLAESRAYHTTIRIGRYVYVVGGLAGGPSNTVERSEIDSENKLGGFGIFPGVNLNTARYGHQSAVIGNFLYVFGGTGTGGDLNTVERAPIDEFDGLGNFEPVSDVTMTTPRSHFAIVKGASYLYVIGGQNAGLPVASVEKIEMYGNGYISGFQDAGNLAQPRANHAALALGNVVYVFGGSGNAGPLDIVESAQFSPEGTLDFNGVPGNFLTEAKASAAVTVVGNYVYMIGGQRTGGGPAELVERASIIDVGALSTFANLPIALNEPRAMHASVVIGKWLYVIGGQNGSGALGTIEVAEIYPDGSLSNFGNYQYALKTARYGHQALIVDDVLYIIGGIDNSGNVLNTVETAKINADGSLEQPQLDPSHPLFSRRGRFSMFASGIYAYAFGGRTASGTTNTDTASIEFATFNSGKQLAGFSDYSLDSIQETREGAASIVLGQFFYVIGGADNTNNRGIAQVAVPVLDMNFASQFAIYGSTLAAPRTGHVVTRVGETLYVIGGATTGADVEDTKVQTNGMFTSFTPRTNVQLMTKRAGHSTVTIENNVYIIGGQAIAGPYLQSIESATIR